MAALAAFYLLALNAYYVGFFNDDAFFIIGARSLLEGRYAALNHPGLAPLVNYTPGYPLLLAPVTALFPSSLRALQLLSVAMTMAALGLQRRVFSEELKDKKTAFLLLALSAVNPLTVSLSGTVLSDVPLLLACALVWHLSRRFWTKGDLRTWIVISLLAGYAALIRPQGAALALALSAALAWERRWKLAALPAAALVLFAGPFLLRNFLLTGRGLMYFSELSAPYERAGAGELPATVLSNAWFYLRAIFVTNLFRWPRFLGGGLDALTVLGGLGAVVWALKNERRSGFWRFAGLFLGIYLAGHLAWSKQAERYILPVMPLALLMLGKGLLALNKRAAYGATALVLLLWTAPLTNIYRASLFLETPLNTPPRKTIAWIEENTGEGDVLAVELDGTWNLLTGRKTVHWLRYGDAASLGAFLDANRAAYVLAQESPFVLRTRSRREMNDPLEAGSLRGWLQQLGWRGVFAEPSEGTELFARPNS